MKIIRSKNLKFIPASHEDPQDPGALKKVLLKRDDLVKGRIQMINWSKIPIGKTFQPHYHQDMEEVFIILSGRAKIPSPRPPSFLPARLCPLCGRAAAKIYQSIIVLIPVTWSFT